MPSKTICLPIGLIASVFIGCESSAHQPQLVTPASHTTIKAPIKRAPAPTVVAVVEPVAIAKPARPAPPSVPGFPTAKSLRILRSAKIYRTASTAAERRGYLVGGTRVMPLQIIKAGGCRYDWIQLDQSAWVCAKSKPSDLQPTERLLGSRRRFGSFGRVRKAGIIYSSRAAVVANEGRVTTGDSVRLRSIVTIDGNRYWTTRTGKYIATKHVSYLGSGSRFGGSRWGDTDVELPRAFVLARRRYGKVIVRATPRRSARVVRRLRHRTMVIVRSTSANGRWLRIGDNEWVPSRRARVARKVAPPSKGAALERWVDVDVSQQVLVAYQGKTPVYVTLISSGKYKRTHRTPAGVYRVQRKVAQTTMRSKPGADDTYSVAGVPWVLYFHGNYALHGAYWHDGFGYRRSHGCINLSPTDAKFVFSFLGPQERPGWWTQRGSKSFPGSIVQIRTKRQPQPRFRGYAKQVRRQAATAIAAM